MKRRRKTFQVILDLATHDEVYLALEQLARLWNVELPTLRKWVREGALPGKRVGRVLRVKTADALAFEADAQRSAHKAEDAVAP